MQLGITDAGTDAELKALSAEDPELSKGLCLKPAVGHVSRSSGLAKTILPGTVKGGRR